MWAEETRSVHRPPKWAAIGPDRITLKVMGVWGLRPQRVAGRARALPSLISSKQRTACHQPGHQQYNEDHDCNEEQYPRDIRRGSRDAAEAEQRGNQRN